MLHQPGAPQAPASLMAISEMPGRGGSIYSVVSLHYSSAGGRMPVTGELVEKIGGVREEIERILGKLNDIRIEGLEWVPLGASRNRDLLFLASDSSRHYENFRGLLVYAVQAVAVAYDTSRGVVGESSGADAGVIEIARRDRREFWRLVEAVVDGSSKSLEVGLVEKTIEKGFSPDYVLFDGSYEKFAQAILVPVKPESEVERSIWSKWAERARALGEIVGSHRAVFVSKNISRSYLTRECGVRVHIGGVDVEAPDFLIVWKAVREALREQREKTPGILWPSTPYVTAKKMRTALLKGGDSMVIAGLPEEYTMFYALLSPWGKAYRITVPGKLTLDEAVAIASDLTKVSVNDGYPYPLAVAHHMCRFTRKEFRSLVAMIAPELESGREPLDHTPKPGPLAGGFLSRESRL